MATWNFNLNGPLDMSPAMIGLQDLPPVLRNFTWLGCDPQRNCTLAAKCLSEELQNDDLSASSSYALVEFARACAPVPLVNVSYEQILDWNSFLVLNQTISVLDLTDQVNQGCHREFCQNLDWEGDPDLSGPGVMVAYMIQAILTSGFLSFYVPLEIAKWNLRRRNPQEKFSLNQLPGVFQSGLPHVFRCFSVFWITSLCFGLAISCATFVNIAKLFTEGEVPRNVASFSSLGTGFSWAATMALVPWSDIGDNRNIEVNGALFGAFFGMGVGAVTINVALHVTWLPVSSPSTSPFGTYCLAALGGYENLKIFLIFTLSCMLAWVVVTFGYYVMTTSRTTRKLGDVAIAFCCFFIMWASLGFFIRLRLESSELSDKGHDGDLRWGFGQVVVVVGWLPMAVEIGIVTKDVLRRRLRAWRKKDDRQHVESAGADVDNNDTPSEDHEESVPRPGELKGKKVKTW